MAPDEQTESAAPGDEPAGEGEASVFGNLPKTRPGARSPRRTTGAPEPKREAPKRSTKASAKAKPPPPPPPPRSREQQQPEPAKPAGQGRGIEDVAWAGVAAAAEAATIGVRLANRALEAMRDAVDRR